MRELIRKILREESSKSGPLSDLEIYIFKFLNDNIKSSKPSLKEIEVVLNQYKSMFNIKPGDVSNYANIYKYNYRQDGSYEDITHDDFIDLMDMKSVRTTNSDSRNFVNSRRGFNGSNLSGEWIKDWSNKRVYVVKSYGYYPIYIYKDGRWFGNKDGYSNSTKKQMSRCRPSGNIIFLPRNVMDSLLKNSTYEQIMNGLTPNVINIKNRIISPKFMFETWRFWEGNFLSKLKIKYKVEDIEEQNGKVLVKIIIDSVKAYNTNYLETHPLEEVKTNINNIIKNAVIIKIEDEIGDFNFSDSEFKDNVMFQFTNNIQ